MNYKNNDIINILEKKVFKNEQTGCWEWLAGKRAGYGAIIIRGKNKSAHRVSWEAYNGPIPEGLNVLHRCDNRPCINPSHLWLGTIKDNNLDKARKNRCNSLKGENQPSSKLFESDIIRIRHLYRLNKKTWSSPKLAIIYNVNQSTIRRIVNKNIWKCVP